MSKPWFKAPSDLMQDYRFFGLSVVNQRHYFCLLMAKSSGLLDQDFGKSDAEFAQAAREALIANFLNVGKTQAGRIKMALTLAGLVDDDWQPIEWCERFGPNAYRGQQDAQQNGNAERQRQYRERKKNAVTDERNAVTDERNAVTDERNVSPISYEEEVRSKKTDTETDTEADETAGTTGASPVVPRAQAHATPSAAPPVDNSFGTAGLANGLPEDRLKDDENVEQPHPKGIPKTASDGAAQVPKEAEDAAMPTPAVPAKPDKPPKAGRKTERGSRLPDDWLLPKVWGDWALGKRPDLNAEDVRHEAECFANFWHAKPGPNARKLDWEATWRNWILRVDSKPRTLPHARASPYPDVSDGVIPLVRSSTMQAAEIARRLIFPESTQHGNERSM